MSNKISRRTFLKVTGASAAALGAAAVLGGCQAGDNFRQETAKRKMESMKKLITD